MVPAGMSETDTMVSAYGRVPWHGHPNAVVLPGGVDYADVLRLGGIDWRVEQMPVYVNDGRGVAFTEIADRLAIVKREDDGSVKPLGIASRRFRPVQNAEGLELLRVLMDDGDIIVETAGSLRDQRTVYVCARLPEDITIGDDRVVPYIIFANSHDGTMAFTVSTGPVRVVCENTLQMALLQCASVWRARHTTGVTARVAEARESLRFVFGYYDEFAREVDALMAQHVTDVEFDSLVQHLFPEPKARDNGRQRDGVPLVVARQVERRNMVTMRWLSDEDWHGTGWGALNAVNGYDLWDRPARTETARMERVAIGTIRGRAPLTNRALDALRSSR